MNGLDSSQSGLDLLGRVSRAGSNGFKGSAGLAGQSDAGFDIAAGLVHRLDG
ncbi:MAG: hypothetical protein HC875_35855, partial [Anaerolineales bacterium]|nr:hypothetical protein [Anaerolineales bacterium]